MKQILQDMINGSSNIIGSPIPTLKRSSLLIATSFTLISSGTERMLVDFGKASYFDKARQQPEKVKMVIEKIKTDGLLATMDAVRSKLSIPIPLGYCNVGVVVEIGEDTHGFKVGDRVISNGPHADIVNVSANLCARIPDAVDDESAAFSIIASIGLQGIRLAQPTLGECFAVTGVGLIGLLTVQLLKAQGCRVLAIDFDEQKLELAKQFGAEICNLARGDNPILMSMSLSRGHGIDGVIITASTTSNEPMTQAAQMCRKRGRIVLVGVTGLELNRADFYKKELSFQVSCSYGPGRYESAYEEQGLDYPIGFVRWTEQRNFEAVLDMMANGQLNVKSLISHRFAFEEASRAYDLLVNDKTVLGMLLEYKSEYQERIISEINLQEHSENKVWDSQKPLVGFIGAGNYASRVLLPAFKYSTVQLHTIVTAGGINGVVQGKKTGFIKASSDVTSMLAREKINTVIIASRHDTHAKFVTKALHANKHVFVEKPLAINLEELSKIETTYYSSELENRRHLMVGFNRRFSPHAKKIKSLLNFVSEPKVFIMTMNVGAIPVDHWTQDINIGGGRIIGEACHFIDLMRFFAGSVITSIEAKKIGSQGSDFLTDDKAIITLGFADGSIGTIHYLANGASSFPKERVEIFVAGRVLQLDNFRLLRGFGWPGFKKMSLWKQDKGQRQCCKAFLDAIEHGKESPIPINEIFEVARVSIETALILRAQKN